MNIPSHSIDINPYLDNIGNWKPSGFFQKIYVINPNVAVALAGSVPIMKSFLQELKIRCGYYPQLNQKIVEAIIRDIEKDKITNTESSQIIESFYFVPSLDKIDEVQKQN